MGFDNKALTAEIDRARELWLEVCTPRLMKAPDLGSIGHDRRDDAGHVQPHVHHARMARATDNHTRLRHIEWEREAQDITARITALLKTIPAFDWPLFTWRIDFKHAQPTKTIAAPLPAYALTLHHNPLTSSKTRTHAGTTRRLLEILLALEGLPRPELQRRFMIGDMTIEADAPESAARLYSALRSSGPHATPGIDPYVLEVLDHEAIWAALRAA